jgi:uncharacterized protein (TIGR02466 family)
MKTEEFVNAFAQPIATFDLELGDAFNQQLAALIEEMRLKSQTDKARSSRGGWRNDGNFFQIENPLIKTLEVACARAAFKFLAECHVSIALQNYTIGMNGWANWNGKGHYNSPHRHIGADVCGSYYIQQPNEDALQTGVIEFLDNRNVIPLQQRLGGPVFSANIKRRPKVGQLIVFPSFLTHWVPPNQSDEGRIVVAWNARLEERKVL